MVTNTDNTDTISLEQRIEKVKELRKQGYNCSQCVMLAFPDVHGFDDETAARLTAACGGGMACGEICGVATAISMLTGMGSWKAPSDKAATYKSVRGLLDGFRSGFGALTCRELKAAGRSCNELIVTGVRMLHEELDR